MFNINENPQKAGSFWQGAPLHLVLIILVCAVAYSNTFNVPFYFDDAPNIAENPQIKDLSYFAGNDIAETFTTYKYFQSRIVGFFTFALNFKIHGLDVRGYHIFNLAVHLINALLVYLLVILSFRTPALRDSELSPQNRLIALFASLLFAAHPIQTQAVTYIVQRFTSLATMFYLSSLLLYVKSRLSENSKKSISLYVLSILFAILSMKTKEIAFTLPLVIVLYELMFLKGTAKKRLLHLIPILLTLLVIPFSILDFHKPIGDLLSESGDVTRLQTAMSRWDYLFTQFRVIVTYIRLLVLPINQNLDYDYPVFHSFFVPQVFLSFLFLVSVLGFGVCMYNRNRLLSFGIFWFFITLAVESSVIPIQDVIFEHRVYLPSAGMLIAIVSAICSISLRFNKSASKTIHVLLSAAILILALTTYHRNSTWRNEIGFWSDVTSKSPLKSRGHYYLGRAYEGSNQTDKAIERYETAVQLEPGFAEPYINLGNIYYSRESYYKALELYLRSIRYKPDSYEAHNNAGNAYNKLGSTDIAIKYYSSALKIKPDSAGAFNNLGNIHRDKGSIDEAIGYYQKALKLKPDIIEAHFNLGLSYLEKGNSGYAKKEFLTVIELNPNDQEAINYIRKLK